MITERSTDRDFAVEDGNLFWREFLVDELRDAPRPVLVTEGTTVPAASLWIGAYRWIKAFGEAGMEPGDRILLDLDPGPAFVQVLLAAFWDQYSVVLTVPDFRDPSCLMERFDARISIGTGDQYSCSIDPDQQGPGASLSLREFQGTVDRKPSVRVYTRRQNREDAPFRGYSTDSILSQLEQLDGLLSDDPLSVSLRSWSRISGLVFGLLEPLLSGRYVVRTRDLTGLVNTVAESIPERLVGLCHADLDLLWSARGAFERTIRDLCHELVLGVDPKQVNTSRLNQLRGRFPNIRIRVCPEVRGTCLGPVLEADERGVFRPLGEETRHNDRDGLDVRTEGVNRIRFQPAEQSQRTQPVPRWVQTGVNPSRQTIRPT